MASNLLNINFKKRYLTSSSGDTYQDGEWKNILFQKLYFSPHKCSAIWTKVFLWNLTTDFIRYLEEKEVLKRELSNRWQEYKVIVTENIVSAG